MFERILNKDSSDSGKKVVNTKKSLYSGLKTIANHKFNEENELNFKKTQIAKTSK